jgi:hypothetical protein
MRTAVLFILSITILSCSRKGTSELSADFQKLSEEAVYKILSFSPVNASGQGLHTYNGEDFDKELDNLNYFTIRKQRDYYVDLHKRLDKFDRSALAPEDRADYEILEYQIGLALFDIDIAESWRHSPQGYVELLGSALFNPVALEYAPLEKRFGDIIARLEKVPAFTETARRQLSEVPAVWIDVAKEENDGNIDLIDHTLREAVPVSLKAAYDNAAGPALDALRLFNRYMETGLARVLPTGGWARIGMQRSSSSLWRPTVHRTRCWAMRKRG